MKQDKTCKGRWHLCDCGERFKLLYVVTRCPKCKRTFHA